MYGKTLKVTFPGAADEYFLVVVTPGDTVRDLKNRHEELRDMCLFRSHNSLPMKETIELHPTVRDGDNLYAASYQDVGLDRLS
jgi:hypothetical protein